MQEAHGRDLAEALEVERRASTGRVRSVEEEMRAAVARVEKQRMEEVGGLREELTVVRAEVGMLQREKEKAQEVVKSELEYALYRQRLELEQASKSEREEIARELAQLKQQKDHAIAALAERFQSELEEARRDARKSAEVSIVCASAYKSRIMFPLGYH